MDDICVRVFSLNCWGIRYISKYCEERYRMIGEMLCKEEHDIILLQEVWSESDYDDLKKNLAHCHPYTHYFRSGVIGSGLAIFSKYTIQDIFMHRYTLNGYPYMVHHGDWFGGKAVGMAVLNINGLIVNVYLTHLHAEYSRENDSYHPHRVVQSWELQQFIRHTSGLADAVILGGDLNMHPQDLGNRLLKSCTGLRDSYVETTVFDGCDDGITLIADNPFTTKKELVPFEKGIRIDYILFKGSSKINMRCDFMSTTKGFVPGSSFPYSDHEALSSHLKMSSRTLPDRDGERSNTPESPTGNLENLVDILTEARTEVKVGLHCCEKKRNTVGRTAVMGFALLLIEVSMATMPCFTLGEPQSFPRISFYLLGVLCFGILLSTFLLYMFYTMELKSLQGAEDQMRLAGNSLQEKLRGVPVAQLHGGTRRPSEEHKIRAVHKEE